MLRLPMKRTACRCTSSCPLLSLCCECSRWNTLCHWNFPSDSRSSAAAMIRSCKVVLRARLARAARASVKHGVSFRNTISNSDGSRSASSTASSTASQRNERLAIMRADCSLTTGDETLSSASSSVASTTSMLIMPFFAVGKLYLVTIRSCTPSAVSSARFDKTLSACSLRLSLVFFRAISSSGSSPPSLMIAPRAADDVDEIPAMVRTPMSWASGSLPAHSTSVSRICK
mmetsp:Transcript_33603/g.77627  ORF Transcript_33603/g.77627 Transcript_33603/m.77627 type:complete len:230 (-) Transcript_33603:657-1346(-)